jgi:tRNA modification GTPase
MSSDQTIFALSTPPGRAAIAVIRLSGPDVSGVIDAMCPPRPEPRHASLRRLKDPATGIVLDEALILFFQGPRSETGEDMAELQVHGGRAIVSSVLDALSRYPGCRAAEPGEFARRAFENGKLDLAQIEGIADLIDAETEAQRQQAVAQATGTQSARFERWRAELLKAMGLVEAAIDFSDEGDVSDRAVEHGAAVAATLRHELAGHLDDGHRGEILREGFRVVLAGPPNAGKSSLLNALARRDAAIVSNEAGTTRDVIDVRLDLDGLAVIVSDTAGIRETSSSVEQEGIRRTLQATRDADLVIWLSEAGDGSALPAEPGDKDLQVLTKCDLIPDSAWIHVKHEGSVGWVNPGRSSPGATQHDSAEHACVGSRKSLTQPTNTHPADTIHVKQPYADVYDLAISTKTGAGLDGLTTLIAARARAATGNPSDPAITRVRHRREIERAVAHLDAFLEDTGRGIELRAEDLRLAATALGRLTGRIDAEEVLGEIFSRFCIGK